MKLPDFRSDLQKNAEKQLQGFGYRMAKNQAQGFKDWKSGKTPYYTTTNLLK